MNDGSCLQLGRGLKGASSGNSVSTRDRSGFLASGINETISDARLMTVAPDATVPAAETVVENVLVPTVSNVTDVPAPGIRDAQSGRTSIANLAPVFPLGSIKKCEACRRETKSRESNDR